MFHLTVRETFEGRTRGQEITDPAEVKRILESRFEHHVVKRWVPDTPAPAKLEAVPAAAATQPAFAPGAALKTAAPVDPDAITVR